MSSENPVEIDESQYTEALNAWLDRPTLKYVAESTGISRDTVKKLRDTGIPEFGLAPFPPAADVRSAQKDTTEPKDMSDFPDDMDAEAVVLLTNEEARKKLEAAKNSIIQMSLATSRLGDETSAKEAEQELDGTISDLDEAEKKLAIEKSRVDGIEKKAIAADNVRRSAQEAAVARQQMNMCVNLGAVFSYFIDNMMLSIERGDVGMPKVLDVKTLGSLTSAMERLTAATERALKIEKGRAGEPENNLGIQIGVMINNCTPAELEEIQQTGTLPQRLRVIEAPAEDVEE